MIRSDDTKCFAVQLCHVVQTHLACGLLVLSSKIIAKNPEFVDVDRATASSKFAAFDDDEDGEEKFVDVDLDANAEEQVDSKPDSTASWVHRNAVPLDAKKKTKLATVGDLDDMRNPDKMSTSTTVAWELERLRNHVHPTVRLFASKLASKQDVSYDGDPLRDFTVVHFLDRFVQKNPKRVEASGSLQPVGKRTRSEPSLTAAVFGLRKLRDPKSRAASLRGVSDEGFMQL
jgi:ribosome biogenesis protein MAK21